MDRLEALEQSRRLVPVLRDRAAQAETLRRVPDTTVADLVASGLLRLCQPARFGGSELGWDVLCEAGIELARGDGAQAWVANVYGQHPYIVALFEDEAQHDVWDGNADALICASLIPQGNRVTAGGDGFHLVGRWSFASGVHHADWIILGDLVGGDPKDHRFFLVPRGAYRIEDDWHTVGMAATGSASVIVDTTVAPHRAVSVRDINAAQAPGARLNTAPLYRMPVLGFAQLGLAAVPVGIAIGMVDDFKHFLRGRAGAAPAPGSELLHERFAEAAAETRAATLLLMDTARQNSAVLGSGAALDEADAARSMRDGGYAVMLARRAAMRLFEVTGGRGLHLDQPLQRAFRDVLGASAHASLGWQRNALRYAQHALNAEIN